MTGSDRLVADVFWLLLLAASASAQDLDPRAYAKVLAALPYSWLSATGDVGAASRQVDRSGLSDMRFRLSVLLAGAPAMTAQQFATSARRPIVGASLTVVAPTGQ